MTTIDELGVQLLLLIFQHSTKLNRHLISTMVTTHFVSLSTILHAQ